MECIECKQNLDNPNTWKRQLECFHFVCTKCALKRRQDFQQNSRMEMSNDLSSMYSPTQKRKSVRDQQNSNPNHSRQGSQESNNNTISNKSDYLMGICKECFKKENKIQSSAAKKQSKKATSPPPPPNLLRNNSVKGFLTNRQQGSMYNNFIQTAKKPVVSGISKKGSVEQQQELNSYKKIQTIQNNLLAHPRNPPASPQNSNQQNEQLKDPQNISLLQTIQQQQQQQQSVGLSLLQNVNISEIVAAEQSTQLSIPLNRKHSLSSLIKGQPQPNTSCSSSSSMKWAGQMNVRNSELQPQNIPDEEYSREEMPRSTRQRSQLDLLILANPKKIQAQQNKVNSYQQYSYQNGQQIKQFQSPMMIEKKKQDKYTLLQEHQQQAIQKWKQYHNQNQQAAIDQHSTSIVDTFCRQQDNNNLTNTSSQYIKNNYPQKHHSSASPPNRSSQKNSNNIVGSTGKRHLSSSSSSDKKREEKRKDQSQQQQSYSRQNERQQHDKNMLSKESKDSRAEFSSSAERVDKFQPVTLSSNNINQSTLTVATKEKRNASSSSERRSGSNSSEREFNNKQQQIAESVLDENDLQQLNVQQQQQQQQQQQLAQSQQQKQIQNLRESLKIQINQNTTSAATNRNNISNHHAHTSSLSSGMASNLFQIQEKDSQQNTQRQNLQEQHFLQGVNWKQLDFIKQANANKENHILNQQQSSTQVLCQHHNEIVSLYCEKDRALLCVSCLFESEEHSKHTVQPLKSATQTVSQNTLLFKNSLKEKNTLLETGFKKCLANRSQIERTFEKTLDTLNKEFQVLKNLLNSKQKALQQQIINTFESAIYKYDVIMQDIKEIKSCVAECNKQSNNLQQQSQQQQSMQDIIIQEHYIFDSLLTSVQNININLQDINKSDLEIASFPFRSETKHCISQYAQVKQLSDRHIGIKLVSSSNSSNTHASILHTKLNSPRDQALQQQSQFLQSKRKSKNNNHSSKSSARDTTNSISPQRYDYVQRTLQAHFSSKTESRSKSRSKQQQQQQQENGDNSSRSKKSPNQQQHQLACNVKKTLDSVNLHAKNNNEHHATSFIVNQNNTSNNNNNTVNYEMVIQLQDVTEKKQNKQQQQQSSTLYQNTLRTQLSAHNRTISNQSFQQQQQIPQYAQQQQHPINSNNTNNNMNNNNTNNTIQGLQNRRIREQIVQSPQFG